MDSDDRDPKSIDPSSPHAFVEKLNMPFAVPRAVGSMGQTGPELAFRRSENPPECGLCGRSKSDRLHLASEEAADEEHWPV